MIAELPIQGEVQGSAPVASYRTALEKAVRSALDFDVSTYFRPEAWQEIIESLAHDGDTSAALEELDTWWERDAPGSGSAMDTARDHINEIAYAYWRLSRIESIRLTTIIQPKQP